MVESGAEGRMIGPQQMMFGGTGEGKSLSGVEGKM
jgi:hypothetical protein